MTSLARCPTHGLWRKSASILLIAPGENNEPHVLTVKRSSKAQFMPSNIVFPGGLCESIDFSTKWLKLDPFLKDFHVHTTAVFPDIFANDSTTPLEELSPHVGFRITAIRELYEETGVLLHSKTGSNVKMIEDYRKKVHKDPDIFTSLFKQLDSTPSVSKLYNWSTWLTPVGLKKSSRRYDTQFYIAFLDNMDDVIPSSDEKEVTEVKFWEPAEILAQALNGNVQVAPPQLYELKRLLNFHTIQQLKQYAKMRDELGTERMFPIFIKCQDGNLSVLPGDSLYPEVPDLTGRYKFLQLDMTLGKCMDLYPRHHRVVYRPGKIPEIVINTELPLKQKPVKANIIHSNL